VCDYDADGDRDLLVGEGDYGRVYFYENTNTDADPVLVATGNRVELECAGSALTVGSRATPFVCDWNGDGLADLLCGDGVGYANYFQNVGTAQSPAYSTRVLLHAGGATLWLGYRSAIRVCDWDNDGRPDLLATAQNTAVWCRNTGSRSNPVLAAPDTLRAPEDGAGLQPIDDYYRMRLDVADWNEDGTPDLLIGANTGTVSYYEGYRFAFRGIIRTSPTSVELSWHSADYLEYDVFAGTAPRQINTLVEPAVSSQGDVTTCPVNPSAGHAFFQVRRR